MGEQHHTMLDEAADEQSQAVPKRRPLSRKTRFEVLKRDKFTCQYCGRQAPEVVLHVDHITPVSKGGTNDITNLVTSCRECNLGKSNRELSDDAVVTKQKAQLDLLQERREQLEMMHEWQMQLTDELINVGDIVSDITKKMTGYELNNSGKAQMSKLVQKFGLSEVCEAARIAFTTYPTDTSEQMAYALGKIGGICYCRAHKTCYKCVHYYKRYGNRHLCHLRVDEHGDHISFRSIAEAESCERFEDKDA